MRVEYTKREKLRARAHFVCQTLTYPIRCIFENYPWDTGTAEFLTPRECLERAKKSRLQDIV